MAYYALETWRPGILAAPEGIDGNSLSAAVGIFTAIVMLAYAGANAVAGGSLSADPWRAERKRWRQPSRSAQSRAPQSTRIMDAEFEEEQSGKRRADAEARDSRKGRYEEEARGPRRRRGGRRRRRPGHGSPDE